MCPFGIQVSNALQSKRKTKNVNAEAYLRSLQRTILSTRSFIDYVIKLRSNVIGSNIMELIKLRSYMKLWYFKLWLLNLPSHRLFVMWLLILISDHLISQLIDFFCEILPDHWVNWMWPNDVVQYSSVKRWSKGFTEIFSSIDGFISLN